MLPSDLPSSAALAFLGDAVHTLYVRRRLVADGISHAKDLNAEALRFEKAVEQEQAFARIEASLTELEAGVYRRAYNSTHLNRPRHVEGKTYRVATGFEAVLGMLAYLGQTDRITELLDAAYPRADEV